MSQSQRVAKNVVIMMATQFLTWGFALLTMIFVPRYFGETASGEMTVAAATIGWCSVLGALNASMVLTKDVARDPSRIGDFILAMLPLRLLLAALTAVFSVLAVNLLHYSPQTRLFAYVMLVPLLWGPIADGLGAMLRGREDFARQSLSSVAEKVLSALLTLALIWAKAPLWAIVAVGIVPSLLSFSIVVTGFRGVKIPRPSRRHLQMARYLLFAGLPYFSAGVFGTIYGTADPLIIKWLDGYAAAGWYGIVKRLFGTALFIPTTVTAALLPQLIRMYHDRRDSFASAVRRMNSLNLICVAPIAVVLIFAPRHLVALMESRHHGEDFHGAIPLFVLWGFALIFWFLSQSIGTALIAADRQATFGRTTAVACALIVPLCIPLTYLTKRYFNNGAIGASISDIVIEIVLLAMYIRALPPGIFGRADIRQIAKIAAAALPMALVMVALTPALGLFALAPAVLAYIAAGYFVKLLEPEDIEILRRIVHKKTSAQQTAASLQAAEGVEAGTGSEAGLAGTMRGRKTLYFTRWGEQNPAVRYKGRRRTGAGLTETGRGADVFISGEKRLSVSETECKQASSQFS